MGRCSRLGDRARLQAEAWRLPHDRRGAEPSPRRSDDVRRAQRRSAFGGVEWFAHCAHRKTRREWTWYWRISSASARRFRCKEHGRFGNPIGGVDPDRLNTFRFEREVLSCQSGTSQAAGRRAILWAVELVTSYVLDRRPSFGESRQFSKNFRIARRCRLL